jgi:membrane fusion protein (multidrug efflux system)
LAPFDGVVGKRDFSNDIKVSESSIVINIEDTSILFVDLDIPETYAPVIKKQLPVEIRFSGYKEKIYMGKIESFASRINIDTRTLSTRIKLINENLEILPGALLEVTIKYNNRNSLSIPDTSVILEGNKVYVYKVLEGNIVKKSEIQIGSRNLGNIEVISGLNVGDLVVAEGLKKVRPGGKIKPITK